MAIHTIKYQYDELLTPALPGLEIHAVYNCESVIEYDDEGNEDSNYLVAIEATVNGVPTHFERFPQAKHGEDAKKFLAKLREAARQALYAQKLREELGQPEKPFAI